MGGGQKVQQTNAGQATAANAGATGSATNASALSSQYNQQQQQQYQNLFGSDGKGGAVGSMMDPSKLNVTSPTGVYGLQKTGADQAATKQYALNAGKINSSAAQSGFGPGTPAGFVESQRNQNANALADTRGSNFGTAVTNQYQDALNNFWKAAAMSQAQGTAAQGGALQGNSTAGNIYGNLYGTAGHGNVVQSSNWLTPIMGAAGTLGSGAMQASAMCCHEGTLVRTIEGELLPIEKCFEGAQLHGLPEWDENPVRVIEPLQFAMRPCVRIVTDGGQELVCSEEHTLLLAGGGYATAVESLEKSIRTRDGSVKVVKLVKVGEHRVVRLRTDPPHVYETNGLLSEE
jgi:hypothetical protein